MFFLYMKHKYKFWMVKSWILVDNRLCKCTIGHIWFVYFITFFCSCSCSAGCCHHPDYWSFGCRGFPQLQTNRIFYPLHARTTQVPLNLFSSTYHEDPSRMLLDKVQVEALCFCPASPVWWSRLTPGTEWCFGRVIMWISGRRTLECLLSTRPCRWWVQQRS